MHKTGVIRKRLLTVASMVVLGAALVAGAGPAAAAEKNPYTPTKVCGSGFYVVNDKGGIGGKAKRYVSFHGEIWGYVYLLYNKSTGQNCVVTLKTEYVGKKTYMRAGLWIQNVGFYDDEGKFKYYAGPVKRKAAGKCVAYAGIIDDGNGYRAQGGRFTYGNCG